MNIGSSLLDIGYSIALSRLIQKTEFRIRNQGESAIEEQERSGLSAFLVLVLVLVLAAFPGVCRRMGGQSRHTVARYRRSGTIQVGLPRKRAGSVTA